MVIFKEGLGRRLRSGHGLVEDIRTSEPLFLLGSCLLAFAVYFRALKGRPIWDDLSYWFLNPAFSGPTPEGYLTFWREYAWPLTASIQKWTLSLWGHGFAAYHATSLFLHLVNSLLVYRIATRLKWPLRRWIFLLFLLHPANVITVSWMIQLKTLVCFLFAALSFLAFERGLFRRTQTRMLMMPIAWVLFLASILAKSASVALPFVLLVFAFKKLSKKELACFVLPFFLLAAAVSARQIYNSYLKTAPDSVSKISELMRGGPPRPAPKPRAHPEASAQTPPEGWVWTPVPVPQVTDSRPALMAKTLTYYFWQSLVPLKNVPVKGKASLRWGPLLVVLLLTHLAIALAVLRKRRKLFWLLLSADFLLLPQAGLVLAPFMNISPVSDQHLYLALPLLIAFWLSLLPKGAAARKKVMTGALPIAFAALFAIQSFQATAYYANEVTFFSASLKSDPLNIPIASNLAGVYARAGRLDLARQVVQETLQAGRGAPGFESSIYYPHLVEVNQELSVANRAAN